jgi:hypothetical protein
LPRWGQYSLSVDRLGDLVRSLAFKVGGKTIAGCGAFKNHLSCLSRSGSVLRQLSEELKGYSTSSGTMRFGIDEPLPVPVVQKLIGVRPQQAFQHEGPHPAAAEARRPAAAPCRRADQVSLRSPGRSPWTAGLPRFNQAVRVPSLGLWHVTAAPL